MKFAPYLLRLTLLVGGICLWFVAPAQGSGCKYCLKYGTSNAACYTSYNGGGSPPQYDTCQPETSTTCKIMCINQCCPWEGEGASEEEEVDAWEEEPI